MQRLRLPALLLALAGYWLPWLTNPAASLQLNGYELSEWITFLPAVRDGTAALSRLQFLLPLSGLALLCALAAARPAPRLALPPLGTNPRVASRPRSGLAALLPTIHWPLGWGLVLLGWLCALIVLPPYPYLLTAHSDPEYQTQLVVAVLTMLACVVAVYLPGDLNALLQLILAAGASAAAITALRALRPMASEVLNATWQVGLGWPLLLLGLAVLAWSSLARLFEPRE